MRVDIFCGNCWEPFTPASLGTSGIGGSETAVIHMARELQALGCHVRVYGESDGTFDGVEYLHWHHWRPALGGDVLISWRNTTPFQFPLRYNKTVLWLHDVGLPELSPAAAKQIDHVAVLSQFHGSTVIPNNPGLRHKLWLVSNGIDTSLYADAPTTPKDPNAFFYSSSPRRGLSRLVDDWPLVRLVHPDAVLNVAYGFDLTIKMHESQGDYYGARAYRRLLEKMLKTDGIVYHGRMPQDKLAALQKTCVAWLYPPSDFEETFCITAVEAQAAYCLPIARANGALPEVIKNGVTWSGYSTEVAVALAANPNQRWLLDNHTWAMKRSWANEAKLWLNQLQ